MIAVSPFPEKGSGAVPRICGGGFACAIGAASGGAGGFPPRGCGGSFEVDAGGLNLTGGAVPLGFLDSSAGGLVVEDNAAVCVGLGEELEAQVLGGGGAGVFPFNMGGVAT